MEDVDIKKVAEDLEYLVAEKDDRMVLNILIGNHPSDIAQLLLGLSEENRKYVFNLLDADTASDVLVELDEVTKERLISELRNERLSEIVDEMDSDDATDLIADLPDNVAEKILANIDREDSAEVKQLLQYDDDTAGGIMALEFVSIDENKTADRAISEIRTKAEEVDEVYNVYVVDKDGLLVGVLPLKALLLARTNQRVKDVMNTDVISVPTDMDQEEVANVFRRYNLVSIPVVDNAGKLVGRITVDDIVDVMEEEASEDIGKMAGLADEEEIRETSVLKISLGRLPWLLVGFVGQLIAAVVLSRFEVTLEEIVIATFFIPLMMAMGGNSGIQASTIMVRGIALGELAPGETWTKLLKEVQVSLFNGTVCSIFLFAVVAIIGEPMFGLVLSLSMLAVILNASFIGAGIPMVLRKVNVDPAIATGPLITTFNDIIGLAIYLGLVTVTLQFL